MRDKVIEKTCRCCYKIKTSFLGYKVELDEKIIANFRWHTDAERFIENHRNYTYEDAKYWAEYDKKGREPVPVRIVE